MFNILTNIHSKWGFGQVQKLCTRPCCCSLCSGLLSHCRLGKQKAHHHFKKLFNFLKRQAFTTDIHWCKLVLSLQKLTLYLHYYIEIYFIYLMFLVEINNTLKCWWEYLQICILYSSYFIQLNLGLKEFHIVIIVYNFPKIIFLEIIVVVRVSDLPKFW